MVGGEAGGVVEGGVGDVVEGGAGGVVEGGVGDVVEGGAGGAVEGVVEIVSGGNTMRTCEEVWEDIKIRGSESWDVLAIAVEHRVKYRMWLEWWGEETL